MCKCGLEQGEERGGGEKSVDFQTQKRKRGENAVMYEYDGDDGREEGEAECRKGKKEESVWRR